MKALNKPKVSQVVKYVALPGIIPRLHRLFGGGFGQLAFLMAQIYSIVRLLPPNHPYLNPSNIGKFGIRHVIAQAGGFLKFDRHHLDQIFVFFIMLAAVIMLAVQFALLLFFLFETVAQAQAFSMFDTADPTDDTAILLLDNIFGVPNFFCSSITGICSSVNATLPFPFHVALHQLFGFYSTAILLIAILIFLYFVVVVIIETTVSGTPFGDRFKSGWVWIRLVVAIGLLMPLGTGLNSGQYIALFAAKAGSGWATNAWVGFNNTMTSSGATNPIGSSGNLVAMPGNQKAAGLIEAMTLFRSCAYGYWKANGRVGATPPSGGDIKPYLRKLKGGSMEITPSTTYVQAVKFSDYSDVNIVFGQEGKQYSGEIGYVKPTCGILNIPVSDLADFGNGGTAGGGAYMREFYFAIAKQLWFKEASIDDYAARAMEVNMGTSPHEACSVSCGKPYMPACGGGSPPPCKANMPDGAWKQDLINDYQSAINSAQVTAWNRYNQQSVGDAVRAKVLVRGWAFAGAWYNEIADQNAMFQNGIGDIPRIGEMPLPMLQVAKVNASLSTSISPLELYNPRITGSGVMKIDEGSKGLDIAAGLNAIHVYFNKDQADQSNPNSSFSGNWFIEAVNWLFGLDGLIEINGQNANIHPLAQLAAVGRGLVEATIRNVMMSSAADAASPFLEAIPIAKPIAGAASSILSSTAFIGLTAGLTLYYIIPFLPFLFVFFAAGSWVKEIFEAMVGIPLWALAHLRIDGDGLPGEAAQNGYFLIFGIFIRPILTVVGLIAAIIILTAQVRILHFIWGLVVDNATGFDGTNNMINAGIHTFDRGTIDQLFFTVIYTIIVYLLANASFKLIDLIPDNIMRWMGSEVQSFSDQDKNPTEGLTNYAVMGGMTIGQQVVGGFTDAAKGISGGVAGMMSTAKTGLGGKPAPPGP